MYSGFPPAISPDEETIVSDTNDTEDPKRKRRTAAFFAPVTEASAHEKNNQSEGEQSHSKRRLNSPEPRTPSPEPLERKITQLQEHFKTFNFEAIADIASYLLRYSNPAEFSTHKATIIDLFQAQRHNFAKHINEELNPCLKLLEQLDLEQARIFCRELLFFFITEHAYWSVFAEHVAEFDASNGLKLESSFELILPKLINGLLKQIEIAAMFNLKLTALFSLQNQSAAIINISYIYRLNQWQEQTRDTEICWRNYLLKPSEFLAFIEALNEFSTRSNKCSKDTDEWRSQGITDKTDSLKDAAILKIIEETTQEKLERKIKTLFADFTKQVIPEDLEPADILITINEFYSAAILLLAQLDYFNTDENNDITTPYWLELIAILRELTLKHSSIVALDVEKENMVFTTESNTTFDFSAGVKDPGHDGDCGYTSFAYGLIYLVLLDRLPEVNRERFYDFIAKALELRAATQNGLKQWLLTHEFSGCLTELSFRLRKYTVHCLQEDYAQSKQHYHHQIWTCYQRYQENLRLRKKLDDKMLTTEERKNSQDRLNQVATDLSFFHFHHFDEFKVFLQQENHSEETVVAWWEATAKAIYFRCIATSQSEYKDKSKASGDTRIYAGVDELAKLAQECCLTVIYSSDITMSALGKSIFIPSETLDEMELAMLMSLNLGTATDKGFWLNAFSDYEAMNIALNNCDDALKAKINAAFVSTAVIPTIRLANENIHWVAILSDVDAALLVNVMSSEPVKTKPENKKIAWDHFKTESSKTNNVAEEHGDNIAYIETATALQM